MDLLASLGLGQAGGGTPNRRGADAEAPSPLGRVSSSNGRAAGGKPGLAQRALASRSALLLAYIFLIHILFMASLARKPAGVCLPGDEGGSRLP